MSSAWNLRRSILGLVCVLGLLAAAAWWGHKRNPAAPPREGASVEPVRQEEGVEIRFIGGVVPLAQGTPIPQELKGGEGHRYELALEEGHFMHVVVQQQGVDVAVLVQKPGQEGRSRVDSPNGNEGLEIVYLVAEQAGTYGIEVVSEDLSVPPGRYEIHLEELRAAETDDRALFEAWKLFRRGEAQRKEHPREALGFYEQALPAWRALGRKDWEAETLHRIGRVRAGLGQHPTALEAFQAALPWFRQQGPKVREGAILNEMGGLFFYQGNLEEALRHSEEARSIYREIGRPALEAEALSNLGNFWSRWGQPEKALELLTQARDLTRRSGDPLSGFYPLHGLGEVYLFLGQLDASRDAFEEALRIADQAGAQDEKADALRSLADLHLRRKELEAARRYLEHGLALARARENRDLEAILLNTLGTLALERAQPQEARAAFENALALSRGTGNRYGEAFALLNLGRARYDARDVEGALRAHEEAAALFQTLEHRRGLVSTLYGSARALNALSRFAEAEQRLIRVGDDTELLRSGTESPDLRGTFFATRQHYFDLYVDVLMNLHLKQPAAGFDHLALEVNERRRARSLLEELGGRGKIRPDASPELMVRRGELQKEIEETEELLLTSRGGDESQAKVLEQRLRSALAELGRMRTESIKEGKKRSGHAEPRPLGFKGLQELLDSQTVLLVFSLGETQSYVWCIADHGRLESRRLPARSWIEERVDKLGRAWSRRDRAGRPEERWAEELSQELLGPVEKLLGTRRLVIVADGALQGLPFAALPDPVDPEVPLLARHEIVYLPSSSVLAVLRQDLRSRATAPGRLIILADPVFGPEDPRLGNRMPTIARPEPDPDLGRAVRDLGIEALQPLPFSAQEAAAISSLLPPDQCRVLSGFDANLAAVEKGALRPYAIVHFATHGLVHPQHPELSGLVLSRVDAAGTFRKGHLRAHQIADLDLRAELVVLSACETGVGTELRGEGTQALTRSFMRAGAPRLVVSLWAVSDEGTAELMERFYRGLFRHQLSASEALRCAQLSLLREKRWSDPFYWAPFVFQGEWEKRVAKPPESDDPIERESGGGMAIRIPDDGFPPPGDDPPRKCPDLSRRIETSAPKEGA
jgi:CHAT domain-containing protein/tetratricopeptide (TPR) repeat protein